VSSPYGTHVRNFAIEVSDFIINARNSDAFVLTKYTSIEVPILKQAFCF
jgi:hypothetical protein